MGLTPLPHDIDEEEVTVECREDGDNDEEEGNAEESNDVQIEAEKSPPVSSIIDYIDYIIDCHKNMITKLKSMVNISLGISCSPVIWSVSCFYWVQGVQAMGRYHDEEAKQKMWLDNVIISLQQNRYHRNN